ncbi:MAG TPA: DUF3618 domain-containing protein [Acidimicrobiia bacterium]|nr:DUF3618 domain-containing protein [Acidimicrobiia bacterium]
MANRTDELREDIDQKRQDIGHTVDQLQNRVSPSRITARGRYRVRRWWIDTKDQVMGNDRAEYPWEAGMRRIAEQAGNVTDKASEIATEVKEGVSETPAVVRRQTQGSPVAAGVIAFGGGLLVGTLLPESTSEGKIAQRLESGVAGLAEEATEIGQQMAEDVKDSAREKIEELKDTASTAAEGVKEEAKQAVTRVRDAEQGEAEQSRDDML